MRLRRLTLIAVACATVVAACGSSSNSTSSTSTSSAASSNGHSGASPQSGVNLTGLADTKPDPSAQHMGGTLTLTSNEGWEHLDPAASYFQIDYMVVYATRRPLYTFTPTSDTPPPMLASGPPRSATDGKTRDRAHQADWKFGPPVNRDITSKDVDWAFERMFNSNVQNGYAPVYFPIVGADPTAHERQADPGDQHSQRHDDRVPSDQAVRRDHGRRADAARHRPRSRRVTRPRRTRAARRRGTRIRRARCSSGRT